MKIQDQVCTLEQAKRLKELGVKPESTFWWMPTKDGPHGEYVQYGWNSGALAPAFNVAELGVMLPFGFDSGKDGIDEDSKTIMGFSCMYDTPKTMEFAIREAQARAAMLIYLLEQNHVTVDEVNARL